MADDLTVNREGDMLVIRIPITKATPSASGKTLVVASTRGNQKTGVQIDGKDLYLGRQRLRVRRAEGHQVIEPRRRNGCRDGYPRLAPRAATMTTRVLEGIQCGSRSFLKHAQAAARSSGRNHETRRFVSATALIIGPLVFAHKESTVRPFLRTRRTVRAPVPARCPTGPL